MKQLQLTIHKKQKDYNIIIGQSLLEKLAEFFDFDNYSQIFVITDENIAPHFLKTLLDTLPKDSAHIIVPAGEKVKTMETVQKIWTGMKDAGCDRKSLVINLGGGVIGDMGGFAASTYMRGIDFINIPTTLLSQVDASVGGKTGINFAGIKNFIGTFEQPIGVLIDTQTLKTLPKREFLAGFAEIIKHGLILDKKYFDQVTSKQPLEFNDEELIEIINGSCEIKKIIVQNDETEKGERKLLNFGHTIGHAIEALSLETEKPLLHGEAISIGMVAETKISELTGMISAKDAQTIEQKLNATGLPTSLRGGTTKQSHINILEKMHSDKKNENGKINFTLLQKLGKATYNHDDISDEVITEAIDYVTK